MATRKGVAMSAQILDPGQLKSVVTQANEVLKNWLKLSWRLRKTMPHKIDAVQLNDEATYLKWTADLAENAADNNARVRDAIRIHDQIFEQQIWPDPSYMASADSSGLLATIDRWLKMDVGLYDAMLLQYNPLDPGHPFPEKQVDKSDTIHDAFHKLAKNTCWFMNEINSVMWVGEPIDPPEAPSDGYGPSGSQIYSLARLELALHRLVQGHMQIATFIPAHLRYVSVTLPHFRKF